MRRLFILALALVLVAVRASAENALDKPRLFDLTLAPGATIHGEEGVDFVIYRISWDGGEKLSIYEGCCPQTFHEDNGARREDVTINGLVARVSTLEDDGRRSREWHIRIEVGQLRWVLHAWYTSLNEKDAAIADEMVASIRLK
jgi:hypothetical protein